jgi:hypothetical protein
MTVESTVMDTEIISHPTRKITAAPSEHRADGRRKVTNCDFIVAQPFHRPPSNHGRSRPSFIMLMFRIITIKIHQLFNVFRRTRSQGLAKALNQSRFMYQNHQLVIYSEQSSSRFKLMSN